MRVVICGRPNAGKSSLFNALLREERVIVTPVAGTTRDAVTATVDIRGIPVSLTDTAGIMKPRTVIEKKAVASAREACRRAHLLLLVVDGHRRITRQDTDFFRSASRLSGGQLLGVINKIDLSARADSAILARYCDRVVAVSAKKERSLHVLEDALYTCAFSGSPRAQEADILLNSRQAHLVAGARAAVVSALRHLRRGVRVEFVAQDMRDAGRQLDEALGTVYGDDVIGKIFSRFCIGK
jgi:tRNA modification GTPase